MGGARNRSRRWAKHVYLENKGSSVEFFLHLSHIYWKVWSLQEGVMAKCPPLARPCLASFVAPEMFNIFLRPWSVQIRSNNLWKTPPLGESWGKPTYIEVPKRKEIDFALGEQVRFKKGRSLTLNAGYRFWKSRSWILKEEVKHMKGGLKLQILRETVGFW